jgi:hypothetical protein
MDDEKGFRQAIDRLGQQTRGGGFACSSRSRRRGRHGPPGRCGWHLQSFDDRFLSDYLIPQTGTPFPGKAPETYVTKDILMLPVLNALAGYFSEIVTGIKRSD